MSKITRREFLRVSATVAAGAFLTACGAKATEVAEEPAEGEVAEEKPMVARPAAFPLTDVPRNRTLVYYNNTPSAGNVNPFASGFTHQNGNAILFEPGAFYSALADKTYMWLAENAKQNEDATDMDHHLPQGHHVERWHPLHSQ